MSFSQNHKMPDWIAERLSPPCFGLLGKLEPCGVGYLIPADDDANWVLLEARPVNAAPDVALLLLETPGEPNFCHGAPCPGGDGFVGRNPVVLEAFDFGADGGVNEPFARDNSVMEPVILPIPGGGPAWINVDACIGHNSFRFVPCLRKVLARAKVICFTLGFLQALLLLERLSPEGGFLLIMGGNFVDAADHLCVTSR